MQSRSQWQWQQRELTAKFLEWKDKERVRRRGLSTQRALAVLGLYEIQIRDALG